MYKPVNCRYFFGDYHRGKNKEECRLLDANPNNQRPWHRSLCDRCPVPALIVESNSRELMLEAEVRRRFLRENVVVTFAVCARHMTELDDARHCPMCAREENA